uniref:SDR family NAD(P)-dependent oxidoreductase n=1 Tax=Ensifer adhaerens TaxID=106592 RepID=UPI003F49294B
MKRLKGKVALVTGGGAGIGLGCVARLLEEGAFVAMIDVDERKCLAAASELAAYEGRLRTYVADVGKEDLIAAVIQKAYRDFGRLDILVNNAGIVHPFKSTHEVTEDEWDRLQAINTKGVFFATKHVLPFMMDQQSGAIVNISSIAAILSFGGISPYHAAKGAVRAMTKNDAMDYAKYNIRINAVLPGFVLTDMVREELETLYPSYEEGLVAATAGQPLNTIGQPSDIAAAVCFLASEDARYITGADIVVDGGYSAR